MDWTALLLTMRLGAVTMLVLLVISVPLAWWLARERRWWATMVEAIVALPLVLPPTVLGFYLLVLLGPNGWVGGFWEGMGGPRLVFSFPGLVIGSVLFSLPFVLQPIQGAFRAIDERHLEAAATLRAHPLDRFITVVIPLSKRGLITGATLGFAHTLGEFGVVLMIGGSIPGRTQVVSIAIYDAVERSDYASAHGLSAAMLAISFVLLLVVYALNRPAERRV